MKECPGVENTLNCNPPCAYILETVNDTQRCAVSYSAGAEVEDFHFYKSSAHGSEPGSICFYLYKWLFMKNMTMESKFFSLAEQRL